MSTWGEWRRDWLIEMIDELGYGGEKWYEVCALAVSHHQEDMDMEPSHLTSIEGKKGIDNFIKALESINDEG